MSSFMQMPERVQLDEATRSETFGRFVLQPLEEGYGTTIGNAFRRVLLASIPGSAISAVRIDGVLHEFQTVEGITEDISEVVLNLKEIRLKQIDKKTNRITFKVTGPIDFTGRHIAEATDAFEILNPEHHIATLAEGVALNVELRIGRGKGYVPSEENRLPDQPVGMIAIDSIYTPVLNVRYLVEPTRVGQKTDYEKLTLEITTDGSISPEEALASAAKILRDHIQLFLNFDAQEAEVAQEEESKEAEVNRVRRILLTPVDELELSVRSHNCLKAANINTISDLVSRQESELLKFRNFGRKSLAELTSIIEDFGLTFGMDVDRYLKEDGAQSK
ncbi:MAG TPA: DNA-directed RNA polymerase subunit alpha [Candidatus Kapabacteria bacterium]|nr:DNA-directed RNA polymerase subunit alpha [Candidatus Kapabacteria bacterium]